MYDILYLSSTIPLEWFMVSTSDHIAGATGLTISSVILKNGTTNWVTPAGAVSELGNGWYRVAPNTTDVNTYGPIALHATATGADPFDAVIAQVKGMNPNASTVVADSVTASVSVSTVADKTGYRLDATGSAALTEGYPGKGATGTIAELLYQILQHLEEAGIVNTTKTVKKRDGATTTSAYTLGLNSDGAPVSITRST